MIVLKFGGTSVGSLERVREAAAIAAAQPAPRAVVVSAASGVTNLLLEAGRQAASGDRGGIATTGQAIVDKHTAILRSLEKDVDGARYDDGTGAKIELPVKLKVHDSLRIGQTTLRYEE